MGAELIEVDAVPYTNPNNYIKQSKVIAENLNKTNNHGVVWANQFDNLENTKSHIETTAEEIWTQTGGEINGFTCAVSGRIIEQKVTFLGKKKIELYGKTYEALHFNFSSADETLPDSKKLNTNIWYDDKTKVWLKASFDKTGFWEYRLKNNN